MIWALSQTSSRIHDKSRPFSPTLSLSLSHSVFYSSSEADEEAYRISKMMLATTAQCHKNTNSIGLLQKTMGIESIGSMAR